jgi:hypothetical protein
LPLISSSLSALGVLAANRGFADQQSGGAKLAELNSVTDLKLMHKLNVVRSFLRLILCFLQFPLGLEPELLISANRSAIFLPDFAGALLNLLFVGLCHAAGSLFQFFRQGQYALDRFSIAYPPREVSVLVGLGKKAGDILPLIHSTLPLK